MTTAEEITQQAREIHLGRTLLTWAAGALFALGWAVAKVAITLWFVAAWMFVALREGWRAAKVSHEPGRPG